MRSFHPFSLSDFIPIQKKPTKILVLDIAIAIDQPNLHLLVAICVGLCVPFFLFLVSCSGLGFLVARVSVFFELSLYRKSHKKQISYPSCV